MVLLSTLMLVWGAHWGS
ncbi:hypothetical protein [Paenibacillus sp. YN15]